MMKLDIDLGTEWVVEMEIDWKSADNSGDKLWILGDGFSPRKQLFLVKGKWLLRIFNIRLRINEKNPCFEFLDFRGHFISQEFINLDHQFIHFTH